jgi:O-antigen/teichoic acid export membrane protein
MKASSRIAINTAMSYTRSLLGVGLALFSSRWILQALGATDFGLFQVVGSLIVFLTFFNSVMASSAARHFAFAIGKGDTDDVNHWFNTSLSIHLILPAVLIVIGWPIAEYAIRHWLTIPPERVDACVTVFRISLIGAFVNMASIPFIAMFTAKQRIAEVSMWAMLKHILILVLAWLLLRAPNDKLIAYATGMVSIHVLIHVIMVTRAFLLFSECKLNVHECFNRKHFIELLGFASWTLIGRTGGILRNQGTSVLINLYFGPVVNAGYGIANQVSTQASALSAAMMSAISPEVTAREGCGQRERMLNLSIRASKFGTLLVMFVGIPFIIEAEYVLDLWLVNPPPYAAILCQLMVATFITDKLGAGYMLAVNAYGKIAVYQATVGGLLLMTLPLVWLLFLLGFSPVSVGIAFLGIQSLCSIGRVLWVRYLFGVPFTQWLTRVVWPCALVAIIACSAALILWLNMLPSFTRLILIFSSSSIAMLLSCLSVGLTVTERKHMLLMAKAGIQRILRYHVNASTKGLSDD